MHSVTETLIKEVSGWTTVLIGAITETRFPGVHILARPSCLEGLA